MDYPSFRLRDGGGAAPPRSGSVDLPFLLLTLLLLGIGVVMVLSASFARAYYSSVSHHNPLYYFSRQLVFSLLGVAGMLAASRLPVRFYERTAFYAWGLSMLLLLLVLVAGEKANGARRWFSFGIRFQPSEIAKVAVILVDARLICASRGGMRTFRFGVLPLAFVALSVVALLVLEPHLSASIIILLITAAMMFLGGGLAAAGLFFATTVLDYSSDRVSAWLNPFGDSSDTGYQIVQSLYAIGSGGLSGLGLGNSRQKYLYLPEEHNDFIFSVVCEELGFIGATLILLLFALLIARGFWLTLHCRSRFSLLVCGGITSLLAFQVLLNVAVVTNLVPCTGISLPFFSYGGTALVIQLAQMGIILSISREIPEKNFFRDRSEASPEEVHA